MERSIVADSELVGGRAERSRRWRTVEEKRRIVEETLAPGASVSQVARLHGVKANQVFQ
jgi:transposase